MDHETKLKKMDKVFADNTFTDAEERYAKATILSVFCQIKIFYETESQSVALLLGHTFGSMLQMLSTDLTDESKEKIQHAVEYFIDLINEDDEDANEHRKSH